MEHKALLYKKLDTDDAIRCRLCSHYCIIPKGKTGHCLARKNISGELYSLNHSKATGLAIDPIEKKPFFHFKPGSQVLSFGTPGCNFRCLNCQNWNMSQSIKENGYSSLSTQSITPSQIVREAAANKVDGIAYTYNEPTIFFEYARDTILECRQDPATKDLDHMFVSNGYFSKECFEMIKNERLLDAIRIDLKFMDDDKYYQTTSARLKPVLDSIERVYRSKIHLEIINLIIPGLNDKPEDIKRLVDYLHSLSPDIPLHFSRFFPYYKLDSIPPTPIKTLQLAKKIAQDSGINYVYIGNTGADGDEDTHCPRCNRLLIKRNRYGIKKNVFKHTKSPLCPYCDHKINLIL